MLLKAWLNLVSDFEFENVAFYFSPDFDFMVLKIIVMSDTV